jgi:hypothetical protein
MSADNVKKIIGRAVTDAAFRELLFNKPDEALAGYDLTEAEIASLKNLTREQFDATASKLEERVSRAGMHLGDFIGDIVGTVGADEASIPALDGSSRDDAGGVLASDDSEVFKDPAYYGGEDTPLQSPVQEAIDEPDGFIAVHDESEPVMMEGLAEPGAEPEQPIDIISAPEEDGRAILPGEDMSSLDEKSNDILPLDGKGGDIAPDM